MATDWSPPLVAEAIQPSFAWCWRHGAKRMAHLSQKVVTSGIACNTISRKWGPTSVSQPPKTFDGSTSANVSLRSVEPSGKSSFVDIFFNLIDTVRPSQVERSGTMLLLSVAMDWSFHSLPKPFSWALLGVANTEQTGQSFSQRIYFVLWFTFNIGRLSLPLTGE